MEISCLVNTYLNLSVTSTQLCFMELRFVLSPMILMMYRALKMNNVLLLKRLQGATTPPLAVTVFLGANDAALLGRTSERQHVPVQEYKENLRRIVHHIKVNSLILQSLYFFYICRFPIQSCGRCHIMAAG